MCGIQWRYVPKRPMRSGSREPCVPTEVPRIHKHALQRCEAFCRRGFSSSVDVPSPLGKEIVQL